MTSLALIALVGAALATLAGVFAADVNRSVRAAEDAQLRQLLAAGELTARASVGRAGPQPGKVELPHDLASHGWSLVYESAADTPDVTRVRVTAASGGGRTVSQTLRYVRAGERWELRLAELE